MCCDTEKTLVSVWSHPLFTKLTNPNPPSSGMDIQSHALPVVSSPLQLDVELVKVEVVVMTEDEQEEVEETVIGSEASNESSAVVSDEGSVTPEILDVER